MDLTPGRKNHIDNLSYEELLYNWRFAPAGDPWFQDKTGKYLGERMKELRNEPGGQERHVSASKSIGCERQRDEQWTRVDAD